MENQQGIPDPVAYASTVGIAMVLTPLVALFRPGWTETGTDNHYFISCFWRSA
jgi:hypothetical protein